MKSSRHLQINTTTWHAPQENHCQPPPKKTVTHAFTIFRNFTACLPKAPPKKDHEDLHLSKANRPNCDSKFNVPNWRV